MKAGFVSPSCNYNIVLSEEDLVRLLDKGYITQNPEKIKGTYRDKYGKSHITSQHHLTYIDEYDEHPVQYIGIVLDRTK